MSHIVFRCFIVLLLLLPAGAEAVMELSVNPGSVSMDVIVGGTVSRALTISNTGPMVHSYSLMTIPTQVLPDLKSYYRFNGELEDLVGVGTAGNANASYAADRNDNAQSALSFNGTSALQTDDPGLENTFSVSFWASPDNSGTPIAQGYYSYGLNTSYLLGPDWGGTGIRAGFGIALIKEGIMLIEHAHGYMPCLLSYSANLTGWHHYTVVFQNHHPTLYIDGLMVATGLVSQRQITYLSGTYGAFIYGSYAGRLDDLCIFNSALTSDQALALCQYTEGSRYSFQSAYGSVESGQQTVAALMMTDSSLPVGSYNDVLTLCQRGPAPEYIQIPVSLDVVAFGPMAPQNVSVSKLADGDIRLQWNPVTQNTNGEPISIGHYTIYASPATYPLPGYQVLGSSSATWYVIDGDLLAGDRWFFYVKAESGMAGD